MDLTKVQQISPYGYLEQFIYTMPQVVELQLSSQQIEKFISFAAVCTVIP